MLRDEIVSVVGGSGFLGRYVVKRLAGDGYRVRVLCRHPHRAEFLKPAGHVGQIVPDYLDLAKPETLKGKLEGSFAVVNLVGLLFESGSQRFGRIHAQGAERLAQEAAAAGVDAFVHVSALGIDKARHSIYARTKLDGEKAVQAAFPQATILRPGILFGPEDNFFNLFARLSVFLPALPAIGGGKTKFQPVYVDDVACAVLRAIKDPATAGNMYELGGPVVYTFRELLQYLGEVTRRRRSMLPLPFPVAKLMGWMMQHLPNPPLTHDQVRLLESDNIVSADALTFADLGIAPHALEAIAPDYLDHYKRAA